MFLSPIATTEIIPQSGWTDTLPCIFPFKDWSGVTYHSCKPDSGKVKIFKISVKSLNITLQEWCATVIDPNGVMEDWKYCDIDLAVTTDVSL